MLLAGNLFLYIFLVLELLYFLNLKFKFFSNNTLILPVCIFSILPFGMLVISFGISDFNILNVALNSYPDDPLYYKLSSSWGSHEGSILFWIAIIGIYKCFYVYYFKLSYGLKYINLLLLLITLYVLFSSNPFQLNTSVDIGLGLNPVLQHFLFIIHPPILFLGFLGLVFPFAIAAQMLEDKKFEKIFFQQILNWAKISWLFLTAGIVLGSFWAYSELGWGGWWFWDPVENISLIPWLLTTALVHSSIISIKKGSLGSWVLNLSLYSFFSCMLGTFLVRSNLIISVHSFANDPLRGAFLIILILYLLIIILRLSLNGLKINDDSKFEIISKEGALLINNLVMVTASIVIFIGTIYPILYEIFFNQIVSIGAPYYNITFNSVMVPAILIMSFAPSFNWGKQTINFHTKYLILFMIYICLIALSSLIFNFIVVFTFFLILPGFIWSVYALKFIINYFSISKLSSYLGHLSILLFTIGAVLTEQLDSDYTLSFDPNKNIHTISENHFAKILNVSEKTKSNYSQIIVDLEINFHDKIINLTPTKNIYQPSGQVTSEVSNKSLLLDNHYVTINVIENDQITLHYVYKPFMNLLWLSLILLILSISLSTFRKHEE